MGVDCGRALERSEDRPADFGVGGWEGRRGCFEKERGGIGIEAVAVAETLEGSSGTSDEGGSEGVGSSGVVSATKGPGRGAFCTFGCLSCTMLFEMSGMRCAAMTASAPEVK